MKLKDILKNVVHNSRIKNNFLFLTIKFEGLDKWSIFDDLGNHILEPKSNDDDKK